MKICLTLITLVCTWKEAEVSPQGNKQFCKNRYVFPSVYLFFFFLFG